MPAAELAQPDGFTVLCICTGNVYRSRLAQDHLRRELRERLGAGAGAFRVASAGTAPAPGPPTPDQLARLLRLGVDAELAHAPTRLVTAADLATADLVVVAAADHRAAVLELDPAAWRRTFTLLELARSAPAVATRRAGPGVPPDAVARARTVLPVAARHRAAIDQPGEHDLLDPFGAEDTALPPVARQIADAVTAVVDALVGNSAMPLPAR